MGIMKTAIRKTIKGLFIQKYIDSVGIKLPKMPNLPKFEAPPLPDLSLIEEELAKIQESYNSSSNDSIYTNEYISASKLYDELISEALVIYDNKISELDNEIDKLRDENTTYDILQNEIIYENQKSDAKAEYDTSKDEARIKSNIDNVTKFKKIPHQNKKKANAAAKKEIENKKGKANNESVELLKKIILKQYTDYAAKEREKFERFKEETVSAYKDTVELFKQVKTEANNYFKEGGAGDKYIEEECDKIDRTFDNFKAAFKELSTDISTMAAKIPNPDVIVTGAAAGIPNPAQKIMIFMVDMKKVLSDIQKISNYIKEILSIAELLNFDINENVSAFKNLWSNFKQKQKDMETSFKQAVKNITKRNKWYLKHEHPKTENETKLAGYMYADVDINWETHDIILKGYKCYCKKEYGRTYVENGVVKKSLWVGGYIKNGGDYIDKKGKHYYYLTTDEVSQISEYNDSDIIDDIKRDSEESGYILSDSDITIDSTETSNSTTLNLADGRTITIDYLATTGDVIKLDDGTIVKVE